MMYFSVEKSCSQNHTGKRRAVLIKGKAWSTIPDTLNCSQDLKFRVMQRSVRERFNWIQGEIGQKQQRREEQWYISRNNRAS